MADSKSAPQSGPDPARPQGSSEPDLNVDPSDLCPSGTSLGHGPNASRDPGSEISDTEVSCDSDSHLIGNKKAERSLTDCIDQFGHIVRDLAVQVRRHSEIMDSLIERSDKSQNKLDYVADRIDVIEHELHASRVAAPADSLLDAKSDICDAVTAKCDSLAESLGDVVAAGLQDCHNGIAKVVNTALLSAHKKTELKICKKT